MTNKKTKIITNCNDCKFRSRSLFSEVPLQALEKAKFVPQVQLFSANTTLLNAQLNQDAIFTVRQGTVKMVRSLPNGNTRITSLLRVGDTLGLRAWQSGIYNFDAIAISDVELCRIPHQELERIRLYTPELDKTVLNRICQEGEMADQWITHFSAGSVNQRLANLLLFLTEYQDNGRKMVKLLSRDDMASILGVRQESVSRAITQFKTDGLIMSHSRGQHSLNLSALRKQSREK